MAPNDRRAVCAAALFTVVFALALLRAHPSLGEQGGAAGRLQSDGSASERADSTRLGSDPGPRGLLFYDDFEYVVDRDKKDERPAFIAQGKWSGVKSINASASRSGGYLYTVDRIPGYEGRFPGRNSNRVLAIEGLPGKFQTQTDFYLQYGDPRDPADQVPGDVWFQFWIYLNYHDDPLDREDQLSGITHGKFLYPSVDGNYPAHPLWLFTIRHSSYVFLKGEAEPREIEASSYQEILLHAESLGREGPYANIRKGPDYNRWKLGQTSLEERIMANRWMLVKLHFDTSTMSAGYEAWLRPLGGKTVKVAEWIDGVTPHFSWKIPADKVGGHKAFRIPTTLGDHSEWGDRAKNNRDCWIYLDDFAVASAEESLPRYAD